MFSHNLDLYIFKNNYT